MNTFIDWLSPLTYLVDPSKRIFILYLLSGIAFAYFLKKIKLSSIIKESGKKRYWLNKSGKADIKWLVINQTIKVFALTPLLIGQLAFTMLIYRILNDTFGPGDFITWSLLPVTIFYTIIFFIFDDFSRFILHYLMHKSPWLWRFHAIHHSAKIMTPLTLYRVHFVEYILYSVRSLIVGGLISGLFIYSFNSKIGFIEIIGINVFVFSFNILAANLRHSHIWLGFGKFENLFISPAQHQIHHSSKYKHLDKNFGSSLAIWDKLFNVWISSKNEQVKYFGLYKQAAPQQIRKQFFGIKR